MDKKKKEKINSKDNGRITKVDLKNKINNGEPQSKKTTTKIDVQPIPKALPVVRSVHIKRLMTLKKKINEKSRIG